MMNFYIILFVATIIAISNVKGNCPSDVETQEYLYSCKTNDEEGQDLSCICTKLNETRKYNCTCFADNPPTTEENYLECLDALRKGQNKSGVYSLKPDNLSPFKAYCDMDTDGGGWTVLQRRVDGSVDFYLNWNDYVHGFGNISQEYWLGLSKVHRLANGSVSTQLRVDMRDKNGSSAYASYSTFYIGGSTTDYTLHVSGYSGTAGDSLGLHNLMKFSTKDKDYDPWNGHCAVQYTGAWWYETCHYSNLNGKYGDDIHGKGVNWYTWKGWEYSLSFTEMKVRHV